MEKHRNVNLVSPYIPANNEVLYPIGEYLYTPSQVGCQIEIHSFAGTKLSTLPFGRVDNFLIKKGTF